MLHSRRFWLGTGAVAAFLGLWQVVGSLNLIRSDLISYPSEVCSTFYRLAATGELGTNTLVSLLAFFEGFAPAVALGILCGIFLATIPRLRYLLDPVIAAIYTAPAIAFIPVLVVWFGAGPESKVASVFLAAVFPIIINTRTGVGEVAEPPMRAAYAFGGSPLQVILKVVLPGSLPAIMAGVRLGLGRGIIGLIAAEMYVSIAGIGRLIQTYTSSARASEIIVLVVVIAAFGFLCVSSMRWLENRLAPWRLDFER